MSPGHTYRPPCGSQPSKPRLSASLIVINSKNEVLLVCRTPGEVIYAGAHVSAFTDILAASNINPSEGISRGKL